MKESLSSLKPFRDKLHGIILALGLLGIAPQIFSAEANLPYQEIGPGVQYVNKRIAEVPWSIHVIKIDRQRDDLKFITTKALGKVYGLSSIVDQVEKVAKRLGQPVAAINGDFFSWRNKSYQGDPRGLQIIEGELLSAPGAASFWMEGSKPKLGKVAAEFQVLWPDGSKSKMGYNEERGDDAVVLATPALAESTRTTNGMELILERDGGDWLPLRAGELYSARVREIATTNTTLAPGILVLSIGPTARVPEIKVGMRLKISTATSPDLSKADWAIGGGPLLVQGGKALLRTKPNENVTLRHPRTALGWNDSDYFFVVVDGRRKNVSDGMTFAELAKEMAALGCNEAINLDGGGSATIWADGKILNQPSDNRVRSVGNALICVRQPSSSHSR